MSRRLQHEFRSLCQKPVPGLRVEPDASNLFRWTAWVTAPQDTVYEDIVYKLSVTFPPTYPNDPPVVKFVTPIFHPNVYKDGNVCISILHPAGDDPYGYEKANERWSPALTIDKVLLSILSMLAEPNPDSPANIEAANVWRANPTNFREIVRAMK